MTCTRCSGGPWLEDLTLAFMQSSTHARSGLYRSLRYPILMRTTPVSARKHENLEDIIVSLFPLFEYFFSYIFKYVFIRSRRCTQSVERCARTGCRREDQLRLISKVREGKFNVIARFLRLNSIFSCRVCLAPQWTHEHVSVPDVF